MHTRHTMRAGPDYGERERGRPRDSRATDRAGADPRLPRCAVAPAPPRGGEYASPRCVAVVRGGTVPRAGPAVWRVRAPRSVLPRPRSQSANRAPANSAETAPRRRRRGARGSGRIYIKAMFCVSNFEMTSRFP